MKPTTKPTKLSAAMSSVIRHLSAGQATDDISTRRALARKGLIARDDSGDWYLTDAGKETAAGLAVT